MTNHNHPIHHTWWYKFKHDYAEQLIIIAVVVAIGLVALRYIAPILDKRRADVEAANGFRLEKPIRVAVPTTHSFDVRSGYTVLKYANVGLTYYAVGEPTVPGTTAKSGRHAYVGSVAVSQDFIRNNWVRFGDIIWERTTKRYYIVEDTMHPRYDRRIDIFTDDMRLATSGSSDTDIVVIRSLKLDVKHDQQTSILR